MKLAWLSVSFIGICLFGDSCGFVSLSEVAYDDSDDFFEEPTDEDYPSYIPVVPFGGGDYEITNTEENEVETGGKRPKPNFDTAPGEDDFGPLPDPETPSLNSVVEKVEKLLSDFKAQQDKIVELEEANRRLIVKLDWIEQMVKTNNIILTNVNQEPNESSKTTLQRVLHIFNRIMRVRIPSGNIAVALRTESNSSADRNKPIVVRFTNFATKMKVLAASNRLARTNMSISSDYSELIAQRRVALVPYLQRARDEGHLAFILYDRLVVDGVRMTLEELQAQEEARKRTEETGEQEEMVNIDPRYK